MADNPPISTTVPETVTVDTGADPAEAQDLHSVFGDYWKEQDSAAAGTATSPKEPEPPPAPAPGEPPPTSEPKGSEPSEPEPKPASSPESKPNITDTSSAVSDEAIAKMELPPNARPELQEQFSKVKEMWIADRARASALRKEVETLNSALNESRTNQLTPEVKADYEHAAAIRRKYDFVSDPEFIHKFQEPIVAHYTELLADVAKALPDPQSGQAWAEHIRQNYSPDHLTKEWWQHAVLDKIPDELDRASARDQVTQLLKMQRERDTEIHRRTNDKSAFDNWIQEKTQHTAQRVQEEIMAEIGIQEKTIQDVLPRDVNAAKTTEERAAIEKHNERFNRLNSFFQDTIKDISANGPRAWVRASVQATRAQLLWENNQNLVKDLENVTKERDQLKKELEKIQGARKRITHTTGTPVTSPGPKNGQGLTLKDLDVRKAMRDYDWGDNRT
jgi:hypothetical protein